MVFFRWPLDGRSAGHRGEKNLMRLVLEEDVRVAGPTVSRPPLHLDLIGYWASGPADDHGFPHPQDLVGAWNREDRCLVVKYLSAGIVFRMYAGYSSCRICDEPVGSKELSDGAWAWPEGLEHYVEKHGVRLPEAFVDDVRAAAGRIAHSVKGEFGTPELWLDGMTEPVGTPEDPRRPVELGVQVWEPTQHEGSFPPRSLSHRSSRS